MGFVVKRSASGYDLDSKTRPPLHAHAATLDAALANLRRDVELGIQKGKLEIADPQSAAPAVFYFGEDLIRTIRYASDLARRSGASEIEPLHLANVCRAASEQAAQQDEKGNRRASARSRSEGPTRIGRKARDILIEASRVARAESSRLVHTAHLRCALRGSEGN